MRTGITLDLENLASEDPASMGLYRVNVTLTLPHRKHRYSWDIAATSERHALERMRHTHSHIWTRDKASRVSLNCKSVRGFARTSYKLNPNVED